MPNTITPLTRRAYETQKRNTEELYRQIVELHNNENLSCRAIAERLQVGKSTVSRHLVSYRNSVPVEEIRPYCRPPKISPQLRSTIGQLVSRQDVPTSGSLATGILNASGTSVTPRTVRRHLVSMNYKNSVPKTVPKLTPVQQQNRVDWCMQHRHFCWDNVWFSDETYIEVNHTVTPVWHKSGERPTVAKPKFRAKIMCWGAVSMRIKSKIAVIEGTMTAQRYVDVLQGYLLDGKSKSTLKKMVFQQDGASCHTAKLTQEFLSSKGLTVLPWPANSPDLNPIENMWAILKQNVEKRAVTTKPQLINVVEEEWEHLDIELVRKTIESMKKRIEQVLEKRGGKCDY